MTTLTSTTKTFTTAIIATAAAVSLTACGSSSTPATPSGKSSTPLASTMSKARAFTTAKASLAAYDKASAPVWEKGKATPHAKQVLSRYWVDVNKIWPVMHFAAEHGITSKNWVEPVLWARPAAVRKDATGSVDKITVRECVDTTKFQQFQLGKRLKKNFTGGGIRVVRLQRGSGDKWLLLSDSNTSLHGGKAQRCAG